MKTALPALLLACVVIALSCTSGKRGYGSGRASAPWQSRYNDKLLRPVTPEQLLREVNVRVDLIPAGRVGRTWHRPMKPRYITIHSTQNYSGNAYNHALALKRGALRATRRPGGNRIGYLTWHFTVQDDVAIQHLPCREQGEHADFDGPGNNYSIGIEMCEHRGNDLASPSIKPPASQPTSLTFTRFRSAMWFPTTTGPVEARIRPTRTAPTSCWRTAAPARAGAGSLAVCSFTTNAFSPAPHVPSADPALF